MAQLLGQPGLPETRFAITRFIWEKVCMQRFVFDKVRGGGFGGQKGQPGKILAKSRRGKTASLPLHLTHSAGWLSYNWVFIST